MAAPPDVSMRELTGSYLLNKTLSDSFDKAFEFQGIPWILRKLVNITTLSLKVTHSTDPENQTTKTLIFTQAASVSIAGLSEEKETRFLDGRETFHSSALFGTSSARSIGLNLATATKGIDGKPLDQELISGFLDEGDEVVVDLIAHMSKGWVMTQIWGFGRDLHGDRRLMRKMVIRKGDEVAYITAWYDWLGREF